MLSGAAYELKMLFEIDRRRFSRRPYHDDAVRTLCDVPVDELAQRVQIQTAVLEHGGDDCNETALQHVPSPVAVDGRSICGAKFSAIRLLPLWMQQDLSIARCQAERTAQIRWSIAGLGCSTNRSSYASTRIRRP